MVVIWLLLVLFFDLQGQDKKNELNQAKEKHFTQKLKCIEEAMVLSGNQLKDALMLHSDGTKKDKCVFSYLKTTSQGLSGSEMFMVSKVFASVMLGECLLKIKQYDKHKHPGCFLVVPNDELRGNNDMPMLKLYKHVVTDKKGNELFENCNPLKEPVTNWNEQNCMCIIYNIPNNNIMPMDQHLQHIQWFMSYNLPLIVNFDSAIQDHFVIKALKKEKKISAILGVHYCEKSVDNKQVQKDKNLVVEEISFYKRGWFQCGVAMIGIIIFCFKLYR